MPPSSPCCQVQGSPSYFVFREKLTELTSFLRLLSLWAVVTHILLVFLQSHFSDSFLYSQSSAWPLNVRTLQKPVQIVLPFPTYTLFSLPVFNSFLTCGHISLIVYIRKQHTFPVKCQRVNIFNFEGHMFFFWASPVAQMVKNLPEMQETWDWSLDWKDPLEEGMAACSSILAWRIPWTEESDMTEWLIHTRVFCHKY